MAATQLEIYNRALQRCGAQRITAINTLTKNANEITACYDLLRRAEMRRNTWRFTIRRCILRSLTPTTMAIGFQPWDATKLYPALSVVSYSSKVYSSTQDLNAGNTPDPTSSVFWQLYYGPTTADVFNASGAYGFGEFVYTPAGTSYDVFMSLANGNADVPSSTAPDYDATVIYAKGAFVTDSSILYESLLDLNVGNTPASSAAAWRAFPAWDSGTTYSGGDFVLSGGLLYISLAGSNTNHTPASSPTFWQQYQVNRTIGNWLWLDDTTVSRIINPQNQYPMHNVFVLPSGYLREADQDPKVGGNSILGAPTGPRYRDWVYEGPYLITTDTGPILYRFVADIADVTQFDPLFDEGFSARIAQEVAEPLTQSTAKLQMITSEYEKAMGDGRLVNGIEIGSAESPQDDWISTRL